MDLAPCEMLARHFWVRDSAGGFTDSVTVLQVLAIGCEGTQETSKTVWCCSSWVASSEGQGLSTCHCWPTQFSSPL